MVFMRTKFVVLVLCCICVAIGQPTHCYKEEEVPTPCNCRQTACKTCYDRECAVYFAFSCPANSGGTCDDCWCAPACTCCHQDQGHPCDCEQECDSCPELKCTDKGTYEVTSVRPAQVSMFQPRWADRTLVTLFGQRFQDTGRITCRWTPLAAAAARRGIDGDLTNVPLGTMSPVELQGTFVGSGAIDCPVPAAFAAQRSGSNGSLVVNATVSLSLVGGGPDVDGNSSWTPEGSFSLVSFFRCDERTCPLTVGECSLAGGLPACTCPGGGAGGSGGCSQCPTSEGGQPCGGSDQGVCDQSSGRCTCLPGWEGAACDQPAEEHCAPGYIAPNCTQLCPGTWECDPSGGSPGSPGCSLVCSGRGSCEDIGCACDAREGYYGPACDQPCPRGGPSFVSNPLVEDALVPCSGHGRCASEGRCVCDEGWVGEACQASCPTSSGEGSDQGSDQGSGQQAGSPCGGPDRGRCVYDQDSQGAACLCTTGYAGPSCELPCPGSSGCGEGGCSAECSSHGSCTAPDQALYSTSWQHAAHDHAGGVVQRQDHHERQSNAGVRASPGQEHVTGKQPLPTSDDSTAICRCQRGYWGQACQRECPGGALEPCSNHGGCDSSTGACSCMAGWGGASCNTTCPLDSRNVPCNGNGLCTRGQGAAPDAVPQCQCFEGWTGDSCSVLHCPYDCHGHGSCAAPPSGTSGSGALPRCQCQGGWSGDYCSRPPSELDATVSWGGGSVLRVSEDQGTVPVNVTLNRLKENLGAIEVAIKCVGLTAQQGSDFLCRGAGADSAQDDEDEETQGQGGGVSGDVLLRWPAGESGVRIVELELLDDGRAEGVESLDMVLVPQGTGIGFDGGQGAGGSANLTVLIAGSQDSGVARDSVQVTVRMCLLPQAIDPSTESGQMFARGLRADLVQQDVLGLGDEQGDRVAVDAVAPAQGGTSALVTVVLLPVGRSAAADAAGQADGSSSSTSTRRSRRRLALANVGTRPGPVPVSGRTVHEHGRRLLTRCALREGRSMAGAPVPDGSSLFGQEHSSLDRQALADAYDGLDRPAPELARRLVELVAATSGALYADGKAYAPYIDPTFEPVVRQSASGGGDGSPGRNGAAWWIVLIAVAVPLAALAGLGYYAWLQRRRISEWILWQAGNMRFVALQDTDHRRTLEHELGMEDLGPAGGRHGGEDGRRRGPPEGYEMAGDGMGGVGSSRGEEDQDQDQHGGGDKDKDEGGGLMARSTRPSMDMSQLSTGSGGVETPTGGGETPGLVHGAEDDLRSADET